MKSGYIPIGGLNVSDSEDSLGETEVADSLNVLFENGQLVNRPPMSLAYTVTVTGKVRYAFSALSNGVRYNFVMTDNNKLWYFPQSGVTTEIAPAAGAFTLLANAATVYFSSAVANNALLIGHGSYIIRALIGGTYTLLTDAPYRYVTGHLARAVAGFKAGGGNGPITVGWSVAGDETNWTGGGSGSTVISDAPDWITGIATIRNVVVVFRKHGMHIMKPTGVSVPAYRIETWNGMSVGCAHPHTLAFDSNMAFFCYNDNVYIFDTQQLVPIGDRIKKLLVPLLLSGVAFKGFITRHGDANVETPRVRYHLFPYSNLYPWLIYDVADQKWSKHSVSVETIGEALPYSGGLAANCDVFGAAVPAIIDGSEPPLLYRWQDGLGCEAGASFASRNIIIGDVEKNYVVNRALVRTRDYGDAYEVFTLASMLNDTLQISPVLVRTGSTNSKRWVRHWADVRQTGQDFVVSMTIAPNKRFATNYIGLQYEDAGDLRGVS